MTSPYLEPVTKRWARLIGVVVLIAAFALTVVFGLNLLDVLRHGESRRALTSSSLVSGLILMALCGICLQAGYRLVSGKADRSGTLFSRPAWFAIGTGLVVITSLMAVLILQARRPTIVDVEVVLTLEGFGIWCLVLAFRRGRR